MTKLENTVYMDWLRGWFMKNGSALPENTDELNYFTAGLIDSFGLIELIASIEKEFKVKFSEQHFKDARFKTVSGLAQIIRELA